MEWLVILGLCAWVWLQSRRIDALSRKLDELERGQAAPMPGSWSAASAQPAPQQEEPLILDRPLPALEEEPLLLTTLAPLEEEPLLLDTPLPIAANESEAAFPGRVLPYEPPSLRTPPPAPPPRTLEKWIAENGLAWLGGGAAALGGIFLVSFFVSQPWFTPAVQMSCAFVLGIALMGFGEWARRISLVRPPGHPLVAALLAGAGAATLYATAWGAHGLHGLIGPWTAAAFLLICALLLAALSFLHGQAFGVLAVIAAMLAPALASLIVWPTHAVTLFVCAVAGGGFALAALRRWAWVAIATLAGLYFWFAAAIAFEEAARAIALLGFAGLGGVALALRPPLDEKTLESGLTWRRMLSTFPGATIATSSVLLIWVWFATTSSLTGAVRGPATIGAMFVALAALAVRARVAPPATLAVAIGALAFGFLAHLATRLSFGPPSTDFYPFILLSAAVVAASAMGTKPHHSARLIVASFGAGGTALLMSLAASSRGDWNSLAAAAALFSGALLLTACAWRAAREAPNPHADNVVDVWAGAGALLLLLGFESALHGFWNTFADAALALGFATAFVWRGWRALRFAALSAAVFTLGHALSNDVIADTLTGARTLWGTLFILAAASATLFAASRVAHQAAPRSMSAESLGVAGVLVALIGVLLALRWFAAGGAGLPLDGFTEFALRALTLIAAGQITLARPGEENGFIAKWRGHFFLGAGLLVMLLFPGFAFNPWWGQAPADIIGPPLFNGMLFGFLAPAALALFAARRLYDTQLWSARIFASAGGLLLLIWSALELRRAFHDADMASAPVGVFEGACYALLFLLSALAIVSSSRMREAQHGTKPFTHDLILMSRASVWAGLIPALLLMLLVRHPWWGAQLAPDSTSASTGLATLAQALGAVLTLFLGRALSRSRATDITRFAAAASAMLLAWSFGHSAIRWLHHRGAMDDSTPLIGVEGLLHSLWPLAFVYAATFIAMRARGRGSARSYLYDLLAIFSTAVWPTLAFAGLGFWLFFNPYWGMAPADVSSLSLAGLCLAMFAAAAWLSTSAPDVPRIRQREWFERFATIAGVAHLVVGVTIGVRRAFHAIDMSEAPALDLEMWTYSAVWALFGAGAFWLGAERRDATLRWSALAILLGAAAYVFFLTLTRLRGVVQIGSALGLAVVLLGVAWFARTYQVGPRLAGSRDMQAITPSARREKRRGRRYRSP